MKLGMRESLVIPSAWRRTFISLKIVYCLLLSEGIYSPFWGVTSSHERQVQKKQHLRLEINAINSITTIHFIDLWSDRDTVITFHCILKSFGRGVTTFCVIPFPMRITCESEVIDQLNQSPPLERMYWRRTKRLDDMSREIQITIILVWRCVFWWWPDSSEVVPLTNSRAIRRFEYCLSITNQVEATL